MYCPLPQNLKEHVFPKLYFPYFGSLETATSATLAINCGPPEAQFDSLGTANLDWDVSCNETSTKRIFSDPDLLDRPSYYFRHNNPGIPAGLGHPNPGGFWSFFNCAGPPNTNPIHREHYFDGSLCHLDIVPWATQSAWSHVPVPVRGELIRNSTGILSEALMKGKGITTIFVRGRTAADTLIELALHGEQLSWEPNLDWHERIEAPRYRFLKGTLRFGDKRKIKLKAINHFQNITHEAAVELVNL